MPISAKRLLRWIWRFLVFVLVGLAAWHFIDFRELGRIFLGVHWPWLAILFVLASLDRVIMADKWRRLLVAAGIPARFTLTLSAYYQAAFMQRFLPSSLGGDALRALIVTGRHGRATVVVASMVIEKLLAMFAALVIALIGGTLVVSEAHEFDLIVVLVSVPVMLAVSIGLLALSLNRGFVDWFLRRIPGAAVRGGLGKVYSDYLAFRGSPRVLIENFLYSLVEQSLQVFMLFGCALVLSVDASMMTLVAAISISQCVRKFAILLEGWVFGEFTNVVVCTMLGIAKAQALAFSLLNHAVGIVAATPGGILFARSAAGLSDVRAFRQRQQRQIAANE